MSIFQYSPRINQPIPGTIVNCGYAQSDFDCPVLASNDKICLARRGIVSSYEKALTCQRSGGIGLIIFDDVEAYAPFSGTLNITAEWINIPVVGLTKRDGEALEALSDALSSLSIILNMIEPGYEEISGTSMAVPFVSGIAAKIWYLRPHCTAEQVRQALYTSAKKLFSNTSPQNDRWYFGNGLVQAEGAYHALLQMPSPCGESNSTSTSTPNGLTNINTGNQTATSTLPPVTLTSGNATYSGNSTGYRYKVNDWWRRLLG
jgi:serine protease